MSTHLTLFQNKQIRRHWDEKAEKRWFSVVDIVSIASGSADGRNYRKVLKNRLKKEGSEVVTNCNQLKMLASDGKYYATDVADVETILRLIQSIPSPNAELPKNNNLLLSLTCSLIYHSIKKKPITSWNNLHSATMHESLSSLVFVRE